MIFNMVKVISGIYKGRNLLTPVSDTKPTKGSVKEAIFSAITPYLRNANILDLFAGSGAFGIEALSRGGAYCVFNDLGKEQKQVLTKNITALDIKNAKILNDDYQKTLQNLNKIGLRYNIVFVDPPYAMDCYELILDTLESLDLLNEEAVIVLESNHSLDLSKYLERYNIKEKKYGYTIVNILKRL